MECVKSWRAGSDLVCLLGRKQRLTVPLPLCFVLQHQLVRISCCQVTRGAVGGFLVGLGAALGNGCTSGHGICGNARLSVRSMFYT